MSVNKYVFRRDDRNFNYARINSGFNSVSFGNDLDYNITYSLDDREEYHYHTVHTPKGVDFARTLYDAIRNIMELCRNSITIHSSDGKLESYVPNIRWCQSYVPNIRW